MIPNWCAKRALALGGRRCKATRLLLPLFLPFDLPFFLLPFVLRPFALEDLAFRARLVELCTKNTQLQHTESKIYYNDNMASGRSKTISIATVVSETPVILRTLCKILQACPVRGTLAAIFSGLIIG